MWVKELVKCGARRGELNRKEQRRQSQGQGQGRKCAETIFLFNLI